MVSKRFHIIVEGRVQGVFFRACTEEEATRRGLTGWVRNRPDGSVEAVIEGETEQVTAMIHWLNKGSPQSIVTRVRVREEDPTKEWPNFTIHY